jgi:hypothetical protein
MPSSPHQPRPGADRRSFGLGRGSQRETCQSRSGPRISAGVLESGGLPLGPRVGLGRLLNFDHPFLPGLAVHIALVPEVPQDDLLIAHADHAIRQKRDLPTSAWGIDHEVRGWCEMCVRSVASGCRHVIWFSLRSKAARHSDKYGGARAVDHAGARGTVAAPGSTSFCCWTTTFAALVQHRTAGDLRGLATAKGMRSLAEDGRRQVCAGVSTPEEVLRACGV